MRRATAVFLALLLSAPALGAEVPAPDPMQGDGRVSPFYTWTGPIPTMPGQMLRTEPLDATLGLPDAGRQFRILYSSTDGVSGTGPVAVSGALFIPNGTAPAGGWPLVAWAHGTVGVADICAPSWSARSVRDADYLGTWLRQGFAVVATDYQGLGTPGPHPYLAVRPEAYSVLDSVRAVLKAFPDLANRIVVVGQSQGAGAAFATAGFAPDYAPELDIRGTVATGLPYITRDLLKAPMPDAAARERPDPTVAYNLYIGLLAQQQDPSLKDTALVTPAAEPLLARARVFCVGPLFSEVTVAGLNRAKALAAGYPAALATVLPLLEYSTVKLRQPLFVGTGDQDHDVPPAMQRSLIRDACAAGSTVEARLYAGLNHGQTVNASLKDSVPFVRKVLAGEPVAPNCEPAPQ